jgi:group II intron maturase
VVYVGDGRQGFDLLGFQCRKVVSWKFRSKRYLQYWPSRRAMQRVWNRIKAITASRHRLPEPIQPIVAEVDRVVRGWDAYFRVGNSARKLNAVNDYCTNDWRGSPLTKRAQHCGLGTAAPAMMCVDSAGSTRPLRQLSTLLMGGDWRRSTVSGPQPLQ